MLSTGAAFLKHAINLPEVEIVSDVSKPEVVVSYGVVTIGKYSAGSAAKDVIRLDPSSEGFASRFGYEISKHRCWQRELDGLTKQVAY